MYDSFCLRHDLSNKQFKRCSLYERNDTQILCTSSFKPLDMALSWFHHCKGLSDSKAHNTQANNLSFENI